MLELFIFLHITIILTMINGSEIYVIKRLHIIGRKLCEETCEETASCVSISYNRNELWCDILGFNQNEFLLDENNSIQEDANCKNHTCPLFHTCVDLYNSGIYCILTECAQPTDPLNAIVLPGYYEIGSRREVECSNGYAMIGSQTYIVCHVNMLWTTWPGSCITCSEPSPITNGGVSAGSVTVGSTRTYSCNSGYSGNGQPGTITCGNDAQWSLTSFSCLRDCGIPPSIARTTRSYSSTVVNSVTTYTCEHGASGGTTSSTCSSSGSWTSVTLQCTRQSSATFNFDGNDPYVFDQAGAAYSWTRHTGQTISVDTGPLGAYSGSYYMYFETSSTAQESTAAMQTRMWFTNLARCVDFYYNMYGVDIGTLSVKYMYEGSTSKYLLWSSTGNKGTTSWYNAKVSINLSQDFKLIFEATDGGANFYGDIAVDYIRVYTSTC